MIVAGFGFRGSATVASLRDALVQAGAPLPLTHLATPDDKASADCFSGLAAELNLPIVSVDAERLARAETITKSELVARQRRTGSVAEAVALVAAGPGGRLLAPRVVSPDRLATCAIAVGAQP